MGKNYSVGQKIFFNYKGEYVKAEITRINKKTLSIISGNLKGRIGYSSVLENPIEIHKPVPCPQLERSKYSSQIDLENMLKEVKQEFSNVFNSIFNEKEKNLLLTIKIYWGKRYTYQRLGTYTFPKKNSHVKDMYKHNTIRISKSLKHTPKFVIKKTIYHELLHIKYRNHRKEFRFYEQKYHRSKESKKYIQLLCQEIRNNGIYRILKLPIMQEKKHEILEKKITKQRSKKDIIIEKAIKLNVFPSYMNKNNIDDLDIRFLTMKIKLKTNI